MKHLNNYITEYIVKKKLDTPIDSEDHYEYFPETKEELSKNIEECLNSKNYNLNCIDTSKITDMSDLFYSSKFENINIDVSNWDVSNVKDMSYMFNECQNFDCDLSKWDVSKVTKMEYMFANCVKFDCDLSDWDVSNVTNMNRIFVYCNKFTGKGLENWNVSNVTNMQNAFKKCLSLKNIPSWYEE